METVTNSGLLVVFYREFFLKGKIEVTLTEIEVWR
jgi:hypothetical protein